jgi:hypothetical protein
VARVGGAVPRETGIRSAVGTPVIVEGRLWGVIFGQTRFLCAYLLAPMLAAVLAAAARQAIHPAGQVMTHRLGGPAARPRGQAQPGPRPSQDGSDAGQ